MQAITMRCCYRCMNYFRYLQMPSKHASIYTLWVSSLLIYWSFSLSNCCKIPNYGIYMLFIDYWWSQAFLYFCPWAIGFLLIICDSYLFCINIFFFPVSPEELSSYLLPTCVLHTHTPAPPPPPPLCFWDLSYFGFCLLLQEDQKMLPFGWWDGLQVWLLEFSPYALDGGRADSWICPFIPTLILMHACAHGHTQ